AGIAQRLDRVAGRLVISAGLLTPSIGIVRHADVYPTLFHHPYIVVGVDQHRGSGVPATRAIDLDRHYRDCPIYTDHANAVVTGRSDRSRYMGPVTVLVGRVVVVVTEIPTVDIVDK